MKVFISFMLILAIVSLIVVVISSEPVNAEEAVAHQTTRGTERNYVGRRLKLPDIFNFDNYKRLFHRVYRGVEEAVRRKYVLARAFRAWISSLKYKYGSISYYFALNQFSDRSPEELKRMHDQQAGHQMEKTNQNKDSHEVSGDIPDFDPEHIEDDLKELTGVWSGRGKLGKSQRQHQTSRRKREASDEPLETIRMGVREAEAYAMEWFPPTPGEVPSFFANRSHLRVRPWLEGSGAPRLELPDEVYLDHSDSGCMFEPRNQGQCGSCYAFVATAIAEWLYCNQTGELVAFSEQYLIDCGMATNLTRGCNGGNIAESAIFIHNYGVQLRANYPYRARVDECPYDENTKPKSMGYIRMELDSGMSIPLDSFEDYLPFAPIYININDENGFHEYGGGVMTAKGCKPDTGHAVVLVGHGRQHGHEYWLIRNSYGVGWGEQGYYKLAKDCDCIDGYGGLYGTEDGVQSVIKMETNTAYDESPLKVHYRKLMRNDLENGLI